MSTGAFFGYLDDDDELLPGGLAVRVAALLEDPSADVSVGAGYRQFSDGSESPVPVPAENSDPMLALLSENWMASCSATFRRGAIDEPALSPVFQRGFFEWTLLAFHLLTNGRRVRFLDTPTFRINASRVSLSKTDAYAAAEFAAVEWMVANTGRGDVRRLLRRRLASIAHSRSETARETRSWGQAWKWHLRSLSLPGGFRYLPYTRWLLPPKANPIG
jgi:hypothetical protein